MAKPKLAFVTRLRMRISGSIYRVTAWNVEHAKRLKSYFANLNEDSHPDAPNDSQLGEASSFNDIETWRRSSGTCLRIKRATREASPWPQMGGLSPQKPIEKWSFILGIGWELGRADGHKQTERAIVPVFQA